MRLRSTLFGACAVSFLVAGAPASGQTVDISQGWSTKQKVFWYTASQGSRLLPLTWLRALEQPGSTTAFLDRAHIDKFRYLPHASAGPGRLPIGFAIDTQERLRPHDDPPALEGRPVQPARPGSG